jgi:hypothetical protein
MLFSNPNAPWVRHAEDLSDAFPGRRPDWIRSIKLSCEARTGMLSFQSMRLVRVDPYYIF